MLRDITYRDTSNQHVVHRVIVHLKVAKLFSDILFDDSCYNELGKVLTRVLTKNLL